MKRKVVRIVDPDRCPQKAANAIEYLKGEPNWKQCVRKKGHPGEHVTGLTEVEAAHLLTWRADHARLTSEVELLRRKIAAFEERQRAARSAEGT